MPRDHYAILGVPRTASAADIKRAYRLQAQRRHPDHCRRRDAAQRFQKIHDAYTALSNPATRTRYDEELRAPNLRSSPRRRQGPRRAGATGEPDLERFIRRQLRRELAGAVRSLGQHQLARLAAKLVRHIGAVIGTR